MAITISSNCSTNDSRVQVPPKQKNEILIFRVADRPLFLWCEGRLWISLSTLSPGLGPLEQTFLLAGELRALSENDGGVFATFDDFYQIAPPDTQTLLRVQKERMMRLIADGEK